MSWVNRKVSAENGRRPVDLIEVERLAELFCTQGEIAHALGCSADTLQRREDFHEAYARGRDHAKRSLRRKQFEMAMEGDKTMLVWLGKQYLDQHDRTRAEISGVEGQPIRIDDVTERLNSKLASLIARCQKVEIPS